MPLHRKKRREIIEWANGLPNFLTLLGVILIRSAEPVYEILRFVRRDEGCLEAARDFSADDWAACYHNPRGAVLTTLHHLGFPVETELVRQCYDQFAVNLRLLNQRREAGENPDQLVYDYYLRDLLTIDPEQLKACLALLEVFSPERLTTAIDCDRMFEDVSPRFFAEVFVPSILEYQETPHALLARAQDGDWDALEKLIRLDKWSLQIPEISRIAYSGNRSHEKAFQEIVGQSYQRPPTGQMDLASVKISLAALLSHCFDAIGLKITAPKIRELFDIVAQDGEGSTGDCHLPSDNVNFAKAIQRAKKPWRQFVPNLPPSMKKLVRQQHKNSSVQARNRRKVG